jgi:TolA-binding protein
VRAPATTAPSTAPPQVDAAQLFIEANAARRAGRDEAALALYRTLQQRFPASREARLSFAIAGSLLLDQGNAEGAAQQFETYIAQAGPLAEDALVGRATALRRLGRVEQERDTWQELLRRFPRSAHAEHARARLNALR